MKKIIRSVKSSLGWGCAIVGAAVLAAGIQSATAQSIGCKIVTGGAGGIDNSQADSMLATDVAGAPNYTQGYWNNLSSTGSGAFMLTNSVGTPYAFNAQWSCGFQDTTGTWTGLGTPDGKLFDAFLSTWGPGAASALSTSCGGSSINNQPIVYVQGLQAWYTAENAEGYDVVLYCNGYSYWETMEGYLESVSGDPLSSTMVEGVSITPHLFSQDTGVFTGTYNQTTSTSSGSPTGGGTYMVFRGLTNDAVLIRMQVSGYSSALNAFQFVPDLKVAPTPTQPTAVPSLDNYAGVPVTFTENATGDPFNPQLWYQWYSDDANGGGVTNAILDETNMTLTVVPTNNPSTYYIQYLVVVSNIWGVSTSAPVTLQVDTAVAPFIITDTTPGPGSSQTSVYAYAGGSIHFSALYGGTPGTYLWESNSVSISGATTTNLTLNNLSLSATAGYDLTCTNTVPPGAASTPASLVVLADPPAPDASVAYAYDVFTNGPVAYWRFSETNDNVANYVQAYDYSGNNHDAAYGVGAFDNYYTIAGPRPSDGYPGFESTNSGVSTLNGTANSSLISPDLNLNANNVTITAWINPSGAVGTFWGLLMWNNGSDKAGFGFGGNTSGGTAELGYTWNANSPSTYNFHSGLYPLIAQWSFAALVITPTNSSIYLYYIDSNAHTTNLFKSVQTIANSAEAFSGGTIRIGSDDGAGRNFNGSLDEVAVFNKSLSENQLQDMFFKALGVQGVGPTPGDPTIYPTTSVYSGQGVILTSIVGGSAPLSYRWQSSPDSVTWTDIPGANGTTLDANPLTVGTVYYHIIASNPIGIATNPNPAAVTFTALPATPAGLWTVDFQVTNNVLNYSTGAGIGHYSGRGILGTGNYWNVLPDNNGAFGYIWQLTSVSDLRDDGVTHSGIYCSVYGGSSGFGSSTNGNVQPDSSDIANLLYQWVTSLNTNNSLQFYGVPDGTYNLCFYGCDGYFGDRGTTFVAHDAQNGDQSASTINTSTILPLQQGVNFVVLSNVHSSGGTLDVDIKPTTPVPSHDPNGEADFNGVQIQLVSYDVPPPTVVLNKSVTYNAGGAATSMSLSWTEGILETSTSLYGPWTPIYSLSPITVTIDQNTPEKFYRVKVE